MIICIEFQLKTKCCSLMKGLLNRLCQLLHRQLVPGNCVSLAMIEQNRHVLIAHSIKRNCSMNVWIVTSYNMARRYVNHFVVFICKQRLNTPIDDADRRPTRKEDGRLILSQ